MIGSGAAGDADFNLPIDHPHRVSWNIDDGRQGEHFPAAHIKAGAMPRADDLVAIQIAISQGTIIMRAHVSNGKKSARDVEHDDLDLIDLQEQALPIPNLTDRSNRDEFTIRFFKLSVVVHALLYQIVAGFSQPVYASFEHLEREQGALQAYGSQIDAQHVQDVFLAQVFHLVQRLAHHAFHQQVG